MSITIQNANGPAAIAVAPSHGSTNPTKDQKMNTTTHSTGGPAAPESRKAMDRDIAKACFEFDPLISDLRLLGAIVDDYLCFEIEAGKYRKEDRECHSPTISRSSFISSPTS